METDSGQRAMLRLREGAMGRRERRLGAEARIRLQLCRDAVRIASHRGGEGYKAREEEVHAMHDGLRAQKRPLPETRPGLPPAVGYVAAPVPLLSAPLLADTAAEAVDVNTVHFLLKDALKQLKERRNMEAEEEERWMAQAKAMTVLSRQLPPRGGRPCALQRQVPAVQVLHVLEGAPAAVHRQSAGFPCCATETWYPQCYCTEDRLVPSGTVLGQSRCAVLCNDSCFVRWCRKPVEFPQVHFLVKVICPLLSCLMLLVRQRRKLWSFRSCSSSLAVDIPVVTQTLIPTPDYSADHRDLAFAAHYWWSMSLLCGSCKFSGAAVEKTFVLPQLQLVEKSDSFYGPSYLAVACSVFDF